MAKNLNWKACKGFLFCETQDFIAKVKFSSYDTTLLLTIKDDSEGYSFIISRNTSDRKFSNAISFFEKFIKEKLEAYYGGQLKTSFEKSCYPY